MTSSIVFEFLDVSFVKWKICRSSRLFIVVVRQISTEVDVFLNWTTTNESSKIVRRVPHATVKQLRQNGFDNFLSLSLTRGKSFRTRVIFSVHKHRKANCPRIVICMSVIISSFSFSFAWFCSNWKTFIDENEFNYSQSFPVECRQMIVGDWIRKEAHHVSYSQTNKWRKSTIISVLERQTSFRWNQCATETTRIKTTDCLDRIFEAWKWFFFQIHTDSLSPFRTRIRETQHRKAHVEFQLFFSNNLC